MKKTRTRFLSMLLALVMVVGLMPTGLFTLTASAAGDNTGWILIGNHDGISKSDPEWWADLCTYLSEKDSTYKIRLTEDIELEDGDEGLHAGLGIYGNKTLDMNGHDLMVHLDGEKNWYQTGSFDEYCLFIIYKDAVFTLENSSGEGGEIQYLGYLSTYISQRLRNVFECHGTMIMNGGNIIGGRSKRDYETGAENFKTSGKHTGYLRCQTNCNGISHPLAAMPCFIPSRMMA
jgi:hypothetical protein